MYDFYSKKNVRYSDVRGKNIKILPILLVNKETLIYENNFNYKKICREKLEKNFLHSPKQLENLRDKIKEIKETFFQKKIIAFHIRNKFNSQYSFDSEARDTKLNDDLSKFIHMLIEEEFNLFLIGDLENIRIKNKNIFTFQISLLAHIQVHYT